MNKKVEFIGLKRDQNGYQTICSQIKALLEDEPDHIANMANVSAAVMAFGNFHWVGFYLVQDQELVLGPFQGPVACTRIAYGKGVCGTSWKDGQTLVVPNVHEFPGHIGCSPYSNSEIVIPVRSNNEIIGVLDIDSTKFDDFNDTDQAGLEAIVHILEAHL